MPEKNPVRGRVISSQVAVITLEPVAVVAKFSGGPRFRSNSASGNRSRSAARFTPYKRGDIESEWSHDLYDDGYIAKRTEYDAVGTKVLVSNLDFALQNLIW
ncbi:unnamed protein product, partial [Ilex paraguariensis]